MERKKTVESYVNNHPQWSEELKLLRKVLQNTELEENIKWGMPVYTLNNKNVVGITGFKKFFGLWFYQGAFLKDSKKLLRNAQEGKTKGMRHLNYSSKADIDMKIVKAYLKEAIQNEKDGKRIKVEKKKWTMPPLLAAALTENPKLETAFGELTRGKQNDYKEYLLSAKREATKISRLEKIKPMILEGKGLNDKYK